MGVLADYLRSEAEQLRAEAHRREEARREWLAAVRQLYDRLEEWLTAADGGRGLLRWTRTPELTRQEPRLGVYSVECLTVSIGSRSAQVAPRARHVVATVRPLGGGPRRADGMIEVKGGASADYYLFRLKGDAGDEWFIRSVALWNSDPPAGVVDPLDQDRFEAALLHALQ